VFRKVGHLRGSLRKRLGLREGAGRIPHANLATTGPNYFLAGAELN
jgi:hypothetical protein